MSNVPDDWHCYFRTCDECGSRYHASEYGCTSCPGPVYMDLTDEGYTLVNEDNERWLWEKTTWKYIHVVEDIDGTKYRIKR